MTALDDEKATLRKAQTALRKTAAQHHESVVEALSGYASKLAQALNLEDGDIVAGFWPIKSELDPRPLMAALTRLGMGNALPATPAAGMPLIFHAWKDGDAVIDGLYGTSEPEPAAPVVTPKLILVPMLAFDDMGYRLGYGGGFYDRTLAQIRAEGNRVRCVGVAYDCQHVEQVPIGIYDAVLDGVLTESGLRLPQT